MHKEGKRNSTNPACIFDLDGTLIDSVYQHVLAWREALGKIGVEISNWRIHRYIGMSDGLIVSSFARETNRVLRSDEAEQLKKLHTEAYLRYAVQVRPLPGAKDLLAALSKLSVPWSIATSGTLERARSAFDMLGIGSNVPVVTREQATHGKPDPDLFLVAAERLNVDITSCVIVGDSVWDLLAARRAKALGIGLLSGGYSEDELVRAGAYRVYQNPADLLEHLGEIGIRTEM